VNKLSKTEKGFTAVEGLLIILILLVIGGIGYMVYHNNHKTNTTTVSTTATKTPSSSSTKSTKSSQKYFTITQWGIKAPYNGNLSLEYSIASSNGQTYAQLSSSQLDASDPECQSDGNDGGIITRYSSTDTVQNQDGTDSGLTPAQYFSKYDISPSTYAHVGDYYYWYSHPQSACGSSQASENIQTQTDNAFKAIVPELKSV
jgi:hypothetical protein